ncbi:MAG: hypothetical protein ACO1NS_12160 [Daejeonella sp.]|uniref:hypothetical protein n=1 Tax=Daejeonella sp. JGW-45 TaxID=3034148 RepID=UPI0023EB45AE|nr:hypothetical protein [Daejeonella sp. JGW-45]
MKKIVFLITLISLLNTGSFAQTASLNIILADILSFSVTQPASLNVNFDTEAKYTNGITALATDHVSVTSSSGFIVKVVAGSVTGSANLAPGTVKITSSIGSTNTGNTSSIIYASEVTLPASGSTPATIITSEKSSWSGTSSTNKFNISYLIGADGAYAGKTTGSNVIPVTYTVIQP